jgi:hypothetical protein
VTVAEATQQIPVETTIANYVGQDPMIPVRDGVKFSRADLALEVMKTRVFKDTTRLPPSPHGEQDQRCSPGSHLAS